MKILVTGATGFVGRALVDGLLDARHDLTAAVRKLSLLLASDVLQVVAGDLNTWSSINQPFNGKLEQTLRDIDVVVHLAARVHVMVDHSSDPLVKFRSENRDATLALAKAAVNADVKRFVYISTIGVNGNASNSPFTEKATPAPHNNYAMSKYEAEQGLLDLAKESAIEIVIIRPPLVYGPSAPGNFSSLLKWINIGIPLPFGSIYNARSLISLDNLVSFIIHCTDHHAAANQLFLISDSEDVSTTELLRKVSKAFGLTSRLLPVPVSFMVLAAYLIGKKDVANRLFESLQIDSSKASDLLEWKPVITMDEQLKKTADAYLKNEKTL